MTRRILTYLRFLLYGVLTLAGLAIILLQFSWVKTTIARTALASLNSSLRGSISVGRVEGNVVTWLHVSDLAIVLEGDTVAAAKHVEASYAPLDLFRGRITISSFSVDSIVAHVTPDSSGGWNILRAFSSRDTIQQPETGGRSSGWLLTADSIRVSVAQAVLETEAGQNGEVCTVEDALLLADLQIDNDTLQASIHHFGFTAHHPDLHLTSCTIDVRVDPDSVRIDSFALATPRNGLEGKGVFGTSSGTAWGMIQSRPLDLGEFADLTATTITAHPVVTCAAFYDGDSLHADIALSQTGSTINVRGWYRTAPPLPEYHGRVNIAAFNLQDWVDGSIDAGMSAGRLQFDGKGVREEDINARVSFNLESLHLRDRAIDTMRGKAVFSSGDLAFILRGSRTGGEASITGTVEAMFDSPQFKLTGSVTRVDLAGFSDLSGKTNVSFSCEGSVPDEGGPSMVFQAEGEVQELDLEHIAGIASRIPFSFRTDGFFNSSRDFAVNCAVSSDTFLLDSVRFPRLVGSAHVTEAALVIDSAVIIHEGFTVLAQGTVRPGGSSDISLSAVIPDASVLTALAGADRMKGRAEVRAHITGSAHAPGVETTIHLEDAAYNSLNIGDLDAQSSAAVILDSTVSCSLMNLRFVWNDSTWRNMDTIRYEAGRDGLQITGIRLVSGPQSIAGEVSMLPSDTVYVDARAERVNVGPLTALLDSVDLSGILTMHMNMQGNITNPVAISSVTMTGLGIGQRLIGDLSVESSLNDSLLKWNVDVFGGAGIAMHCNGTLPVRLHPDSATGLLDRGQPVEVFARIDTFRLQDIAVLSNAKWSLSGIAGGELQLHGVLDSLRSSGGVYLRDGAFAFPSEGIQYSDIRLRAGLSGSQVTLDEFHVAGGKGSMTGSGSIPFHYGNGEWLAEPSIRLVAKSFDVMDSPRFSATISGAVDLAAKHGDLSCDGGITIDRSRVYIPAIMSQRAGEAKQDPILIAVMHRADSVAADTVALDSLSRPGRRLPSVSGTIRIDIPKATWLRGPRTNVELSGRVDVTLDSGSVRLGGYLVVEQGTYDFYGKRFVVRKGRLDFTGGEKIDPSLVVDVEYTFRTESEENEMQIQIRGTASVPIIDFFVNRVRVSESDAISYLLFGRKTDELDAGARSSVSDMADAIAKDFAATMINTQLSSTVGRTLGLDVIRVSGEEDWSKTTLTAGKYVGDDLYVAYERGVSSTGSGNTVFQKTMLEYYLSKLFKVRLVGATDKTSGADVFLRFD
jgi:translocation and assembly module TamB